MIKIREIVPFFFVLRTFIIKATIIAVGLVSILWTSGCLYGSFYYSFMPQQTYYLPVNFVFDPCPIDSEKERCSFLSATIDFQSLDHHKNNENYLMADQIYSISLDLELPLDDINQSIGMFMACLDLETKEGHSIEKATTCNSGHAMASTTTSITRFINKLLLHGLDNSGAGKEAISIEFFGHFKDDILTPAAKAHLQIKSRYLGVSKAWLRLHAHFHGLRFFMYHYPISSGLVGITFISIFLLSILFLVLGKMLDPVVITEYETSSSESISALVKKGCSSCEVPNRLERCPNFSKIAEKVVKSKHEEDDDENVVISRKRQDNLHED